MIVLENFELEDNSLCNCLQVLSLGQMLTTTEFKSVTRESDRMLLGFDFCFGYLYVFFQPQDSPLECLNQEIYFV